MPVRLLTSVLFWIILALGLWVRLNFVLGVDVLLHSDMASFDLRGMTILTQGQFSASANSLGLDASTYRPPFYPLFLACIYGVFGHNLHVVYMIQALLGTLTLVAVYFLGKRLCPSSTFLAELTGLAAMAFCAFYSPLIGYCGILVSETLFMTLLVWTMLGVLSGFDRQQAPVSSTLFWLTGIGAGLCTLTRPIGFPVLLMALVILYLYRRYAIKPALVVLLLTAFTIAPWTIRNYQEFHRLVLVENSTGINMAIGNNDLANGDFTPAYETTWLYRDAMAKSKTIVDLDHHLTENVFQWIIQHPQRYAGLVGKRLQMYFVLENEHYSTLYQWKRIPWFKQSRDMIFRLVLQGLAILGILMAFILRNPAAVVLGTSGCFFYVIPALCMYHTRYRHPGLPFVFLLAAFALACLARFACMRLRSRKALL